MEKKRNRHIIVLRFSALGDVAISAPLLRAYAVANPDILFTMVSRPMLEPLFKGVNNLRFFATDLEGRHKGIFGLARLHRELKALAPSGVADIHSVLRTFVLKLFFRFDGITVNSLKKKRRERRKLTKRKGKKLRELPSMMSRYEKVLVQTGLSNMDFSANGFIKNKKAVNEKFRIGIAPFAKHQEKEWPAEYTESVVSALCENGRYSVFLFGGKGRESVLLQEWENKYPNVESAAGKYTFSEELELTASLDLMISMDSANMHFASCVHTPVLSIWGATHPYMGFYGWGQDTEMALQTSLECRPCSVYGNKKCYRNNRLCLHKIRPDYVLERIYEFLAFNSDTDEQ